MRKSRSSPGSDSSASARELALTAHQAFRTRRLRRDQIRNAPYNPRRISPHNREKLRQNLRAVGLLGPVTWNARTGNLVGGHQRLAILDALEGRGDYELDVAAVDLDDAEERAQNVALNNPKLQGSWDEAMLTELARVPEFDMSMTGFDPADLEVLLTDPDVAASFVPGETAQKMIDDLAEMSTQAAAPTREKVASKAGAAKKPEPDKEKVQESWADVYRRRRKSDAGDTEHYAVIMFRSTEERAAFCAQLGLPASTGTVDADAVPGLPGRIDDDI